MVAWGYCMLFLVFFEQIYGQRPLFRHILGCFFTFLSHFLCFRGKTKGLFFAILEEKRVHETHYGDKVQYFGVFLTMGRYF